MQSDSCGSVCQAIGTGGAGQGIGNLVGPIVEAGKTIYSCLRRKYRDIKNLEANFEGLKEAEQCLLQTEGDVNYFITRNQVMRKRKNKCTEWLDKVAKMKPNVVALKGRYQREISSAGGASLLRTRLKLSRKIKEVTSSVLDLINAKPPNDELLEEELPDKVVRRFCREMDEFPSLHERVKAILELLNNDSIKKIGIWGMAGVGKTTVLECLNDEVGKLSMFDIVLWITMPKKIDVHEMQQNLLQRLRVKTEHPSDPEELISKLLENKKYLLLLDGVPSYFRLCDIGFRDNHNCKVVLTTREREICRLMETMEEMEVGKLSSEDAHKLFYGIVGEAIDTSSKKRIARRVLKRCGGLPNVIKLIANHLKDKPSEESWQGILLKLQNPIKHKLKHLDDTINAFFLVFEKLDDTSKKCVLYTASFPEDHEIYRDYLIECWKVEELIGNQMTFRQARLQGWASLDLFIDACLFDRGENSKFVKMPIIIRNAARGVAENTKFGLLVKDIGELENNSLLVNARVISLVNSNVDMLPDGPVCSKISTLFLQRNPELSQISPVFFDRMSNLKLLDLCKTGINSLPPSIAKLTDLRGLYLNDCCNLVLLPAEIGQLRKLEVLDIRCTRIHDFPCVVGQLLDLRCLRVSYKSAVSDQNCVEANGTEVTPSTIIEPLRYLEELTIDADPNPKNSNWNVIAPAIVRQVASLNWLSTLSFYFPSAKALESFTNGNSWRGRCQRGDQFIPGDNFRSFNFYVGCQETCKSSTRDVPECSAQRYLYYSGGSDTPQAIKDVLTKTCSFELVAHRNIINFSEFGIDHMEGLEICVVEECNNMTAILGNQILEAAAFPSLKQLQLHNLQQLDAISQGPIHSKSFAMLTCLILCDCPSIVEVVSSDMANVLCKLERLRVERCSQVKEIIAMGNQSSWMDAFPKLKFLELVTLERLVHIHSNDLFRWGDFQEIYIFQCDSLANLHLSTVNTRNLRQIRCTEAWWAALSMNNGDKAKVKDLCRFV